MFYSEYDPQIYKGDPRTCSIFIQALGSNWGYTGFSRDQNNCDSSGAYGLRQSVKINKRETLHGTRRSWMHFVWGCFCLCGRQKPKYPHLSPITQGDIRGLGSSLYMYICGMISSWQRYHCNLVVIMLVGLRGNFERGSTVKWALTSL